MYQTGDWVMETETGRVGYIYQMESYLYMKVKFENALVLRHATELEKAPVQLKQRDIKAMIELALATKDEEWFTELTQQLKLVV